MANPERQMTALPTAGGSYTLFLRLTASATIRVGRLGRFDFPAGTYAYFGSAFGPGGLQARLGRHLRGGGALRWHVDYLRSRATVAGYCYTVSTQRLECVWSRAAAAWPGASAPVPGFGASDCRAGCPAHLFLLSPSHHFAFAKLLAASAHLPVEAIVCTVNTPFTT